MLIDTYRRRIVAQVVEIARDDPPLVKQVIAELRKSGDIEPDDLVYLEQIADKWIKVAEDNRRRERLR